MFGIRTRCPPTLLLHQPLFKWHTSRQTMRKRRKTVCHNFCIRILPQHQMSMSADTGAAFINSNEARTKAIETPLDELKQPLGDVHTGVLRLISEFAKPYAVFDKGAFGKYEITNECKTADSMYGVNTLSVSGRCSPATRYVLRSLSSLYGVASPKF